MEKKGGEATRGRKMTKTQPALDPEGWMDTGWQRREKGPK